MPDAMTASVSLCCVTSYMACGYDIVLTDDVDKRSCGTALNRRRRNDDGLVEGVHLEAHVDKLSGPKLEIRVGKFRLHLDCAGRLIDLIVDAGHLAGVDNSLAIVAKHINRERTFCRSCVDAKYLLLRKTELNGDRLELRDHHHARRVRRLDDVALIDLTKSGAARKRRYDLGVTERGLRIVDRRLIGFHQCFELRNQRLLGVGLLRGAALDAASC